MKLTSKTAQRLEILLGEEQDGAVYLIDEIISVKNELKEIVTNHTPLNINANILKLIEEIESVKNSKFSDLSVENDTLPK